MNKRSGLGPGTALSLDCRTEIINSKSEYRNRVVSNKSKIQNFKIQNKSNSMRGEFFCFGHLYFGNLNLFRISDFVLRIYFFPSFET